VMPDQPQNIGSLMQPTGGHSISIQGGQYIVISPTGAAVYSTTDPNAAQQIRTQLDAGRGGYISGLRR